VHVFILPETPCRTSSPCVPIVAARFQSSGNTIMNLNGSLNAGKYFVRIFYSSAIQNDSVSFDVLDPACVAVNCLNGGTCFNGLCSCPSGFTNSTCSVPVDSCTKAGVNCGIWGTCNGNGGCSCLAQWTGELCQYPPKCNIQCSHGGYPNAPLSVLQPGNVFGCTYCKCPGSWQGSTCDQCGVKCFNGGYTDGNCANCTCPTWYTGTSCQQKYWLASFIVTLNPVNLDLNKPSDRTVWENAILQDLIGSLNLGSPYNTAPTNYLSIRSLGTTATVWITAGSKSIFVRSNIWRQVTGQNDGDPSQDIDFQYTLMGEKVVASSYMQQDPPNAGGIICPSVILTILLVLLGTWMRS